MSFFPPDVHDPKERLGPQYMVLSKLFVGPIRRKPLQVPEWVRSRHSVEHREFPSVVVKCCLIAPWIVLTSAVVSQLLPVA